MDSKHIHSLIEKFERSIAENERIVSSLNSLGNTIYHLDRSISKVDKSFIDFYKVNDFENIIKKSKETIDSIQLVKKQYLDILKFVEEFKNVQSDLVNVQKNINEEYSRLVGLNSERLSLKEDLDEFKKYINVLKLDISSDFKKVHDSNSEIKKDISSLGDIIDIKYGGFKEDILSSIKELLENNNKENEQALTAIETKVGVMDIEQEYHFKLLLMNEDINELIILANEGNKDAQYNLGIFYELKQRNEEESFKWYKHAAQNGHIEAQCALAECYENGFGVEINSKKAAKWYEEAAQNGHIKALYNLAECYETGFGVEINSDKATKWYGEFEKIYNSYSDLANKGCAKSQYLLAKLHKDGDVLEQDHEEAIKWYEKAAKQNHIEAQYSLAEYYTNGYVEDKDEEAIEWYEKAAILGQVDAQYTLGELYKSGIIVNENYDTAIKWYKKAANQNYVAAQYKVGLCYRNKGDIYKNDGTLEGDIGKIVGSEAYFEEAIKWYEKAAFKDYSDAQFALGEMYYNGKGVKQDNSEAISWYEKAANQGNVNAQYILNSIVNK